MVPRTVLYLSLALPLSAQNAVISTGAPRNGETPVVHDPTHPAPTRLHSLLVLSKRAHTLAIVDPTSLQVLARIPVGNDPHEVIASADGSTAFVSNYGFGAYNTLAVVNLIHQSALPAIDLGALRGPHGLTFVDDKVWFTAEAAKAIGRYDPATKQVDWILGTGQNRTHMLFIAPDLSRIVTANVNSATISLFEKAPMPLPGPSGPPPIPESSALTVANSSPAKSSFHETSPPPPGPPPGPPREDWNQTIIPVGRGSEGFDLSPDNKEIWVANAEDHTLSVIDVATKRVVATLPVAIEHANRLKFTPDGTHVLISSLGGTALTIFDAHTRQPIKQLNLGRGAAGILIEPTGHRAFVACSPDNFVAVINLHTLTVTGHIDAGPDPDGLAWATRP